MLDTVEATLYMKNSSVTVSSVDHEFSFFLSKIPAERARNKTQTPRKWPRRTVDCAAGA